MMASVYKEGYLKLGVTMDISLGINLQGKEWAEVTFAGLDGEGRPFVLQIFPDEWEKFMKMYRSARKEARKKERELRKKEALAELE